MDLATVSVAEGGSVTTVDLAVATAPPRHGGGGCFPLRCGVLIWDIGLVTIVRRLFDLGCRFCGDS